MKICTKILIYSFLVIISVTLSFGHIQSESQCFEKNAKVENCLDCLCLRQTSTIYDDNSLSKINMTFLYIEFGLYLKTLEENKIALNLFKPPNREYFSTY